MMRGKSSSSLQKTYDECYLTCSTAVYFESQGNEAEALRSWRSALDNIYYHNAKTPANFIPKSETEKALRDSLRDMEIQCKERVDLLEALRLSRAEAATDKDGSSGSGNASSSAASGVSKLLKPSPWGTSESAVDKEAEKSVPGSVGEGTIPAINYSDLSRPDLRSSSSSYNSRPFAPSRNSSTTAVLGRNPSNSSMSTSNHMEAALKAARNPGIGLDSLSQLPPLPPLPPRTVSSTTASSSRKKSSRSPSPHKERTMLTTLRFGRGEKRPAKPTQRNSGNGSQDTVGGKAATLAWNALKKRDEGTRNTPLEIAASSAALDASRKTSLPLSERNSPENRTSYDSQIRRMVGGLPGQKIRSSSDAPREAAKQRPSSYPFPGQEDLRRASREENGSSVEQREFSGSSLLSGSAVDDRYGDSNTNDGGPGRFTPNSDPETGTNKLRRKPVAPPPAPGHFEPTTYPTYLREYPETTSRKVAVERQSVLPLRTNSPHKPERRERERVSYSRHAMNISSPRKNSMDERDAAGRRAARGAAHALRDSNGDDEQSSTSYDERAAPVRRVKRRVPKQKQDEDPILAGIDEPAKSESEDEADTEKSEWDKKVKHLLKHLPRGCDEAAAKAIFNDIVIHGDIVHWSDVAGLEPAKNALKEAVVYPFLRPDLFMGLREPARGMLLFGPPGTGKTMLARAVATESKSTFFGVSASSLTSKYLGESEKLVKALFLLAKVLAPSIIFVDEIDSLLGSRGGGGEHEATRRIKTEFLIQWSDLQKAAAGREQTDKDKERGDASRVLVLAATNMPWAIDDAARRRFVRRQYIPLPERETRAVQLKTLLGHQKHSLTDEEFEKLVDMTDGFSGSDITALAKDAAMGPLRSLGEALLHMTMDEIRPIGLEDFEKSMENIRPSVSKDGLKQYEEWAAEFGERGG